MNKFFDVHCNSTKHKSWKSWFVIAKDVAQAKEIVKVLKKQIANKVDLLASEDNIQELINSGEVGVLCMQLVVMDYKLLGQKSEPKQLKNPWIFDETIK